MPMQPSPIAETSGPRVPSLRRSMPHSPAGSVAPAGARVVHRFFRISCLILRPRARFVLALVAWTFAGCGTFRLTAGYCIGLGASVKASLVDASFVAGASVEVGNVYGVTGTQRITEFGLPLIAR